MARREVNNQAVYFIMIPHRIPWEGKSWFLFKPCKIGFKSAPSPSMYKNTEQLLYVIILHEGLKNDRFQSFGQVTCYHNACWTCTYSTGIAHFHLLLVYVALIRCRITDAQILWKRIPPFDENLAECKHHSVIYKHFNSFILPRKRLNLTAEILPHYSQILFMFPTNLCTRLVSWLMN